VNGVAGLNATFWRVRPEERRSSHQCHDARQMGVVNAKVLEMGMSVADIINVAACFPFTLPHQRCNGVLRKPAGTLGMSPVNHIGESFDRPATSQNDAFPQLPVNHGDLLALLQVGERLRPIRISHLEGDAVARAAPVKSKDKARFLRSSPVVIGVDTKLAMKARQPGALGVQEREAWVPHQ